MKLTIETSGSSPERIDQIGDIVAAYVSNNHVAPADLPALIATVHAALEGLTAGVGGTPAAEPNADKPTAAQIRKSITAEHLISFVDGQPYKTLKRHLSKHELDPASYRERYGLPANYPMVAPSYSEKRSNLARSLGLGQPRAKAVEQEDVKPARKGRKKAT